MTSSYRVLFTDACEANNRWDILGKPDGNNIVSVPFMLKMVTLDKFFCPYSEAQWEVFPKWKTAQTDSGSWDLPHVNSVQLHRALDCGFERVSSWRKLVPCSGPMELGCAHLGLCNLGPKGSWGSAPRGAKALASPCWGGKPAGALSNLKKKLLSSQPKWDFWCCLYGEPYQLLLLPIPDSVSSCLTNKLAQQVKWMSSCSY